MHTTNNNDGSCFYTGKQGLIYHNSVNTVSEKAFKLVALSREEKFKQFIRPTDKVLEYGIGTGWNLSLIKCKKKYGLDLADHIFQTSINKDIKFIADIEIIAPASIDVVICHHVLEHTYAPLETLKKIKSILKPNGKLLLYVPVEEGYRFSDFSNKDKNHHLYSWNCQSLGNLVSLAGFKLKKCQKQTFGYDRLSSIMASHIKRCSYKAFKVINKLCHIIRHDREVFAYCIKEE